MRVTPLGTASSCSPSPARSLFPTVILLPSSLLIPRFHSTPYQRKTFLTLSSSTTYELDHDHSPYLSLRPTRLSPPSSLSLTKSTIDHNLFGNLTFATPCPLIQRPEPETHVAPRLRARTSSRATHHTTRATRSAMSFRTNSKI